MLPFDNKPWAKRVARMVIVVTLVAAVGVPFVLHSRGTLDLPMIVGIVLLVLAIVPPNVAVLRRKPGERATLRTILPTRVVGH